MSNEKLEFRNIFPTDMKNWILSEGNEVGTIILRTMIGILWFSQAMIKLINRSPDMYEDYDSFLGLLNWARITHPWEFVVDILSNFIIPHYGLILILVLIAEFSIAFSLGLGLFSRLGSVLGIVMGCSLWVLTLGWGEWYWTYPLIVVPHVLFLLSRSGKILGADRALLHSNKNNKIINLLA